MAKVSTATVRLVLKRNRQNGNGENPIYLVVSFHGRKEISTGVFINERFWNQGREEVRKSCSNALLLNHRLNEIKYRVIAKRDRYDLEGRVYTPAILLEEDKAPVGNSYHVLVDNFISERHVSFSTQRLYRYNDRLLDKYFGRNDYIINELTVGTIKRFIEGLNVSDHTKRNILGRIAAIWNYAIEKGICSDSDYPFRDFVYTKKYKPNNRTYYLDGANLIKIRDWVLNRCIISDGELYSYRTGIEDRLMERYSIEFAGLFFLMAFRMNGSAPVDVALLKVSNCQRVTVNNEDYWKLSFVRSKTHIPVKVLLKRDILTMIGFEHYLHTANLRDGFIYPILKSDDVHERINAMNKFCLYANRNLKDIARMVNASTVESNVRNGANEPLIDVERLSLYTARHTKANDYLSHDGANLHALATLMGRSPNTLSVYVHQLKSDEELAEAEELSSI